MYTDDDRIITLRACPFCGKDDGLWFDSAAPLRLSAEFIATEEAASMWVACNHCGSHGPKGSGARGAVELWNKRAE